MQDFATGKAAARGGAMPKLNCSGLLFKNYRHAVRIMKITAFILLAFCLHVAAKTRAQGSITLKEKGASIIKVMTEVQRQTGYDFLVTSETINRAKLIDIEVKDASLTQVLEIVFKNQPLTYTIKDKLITIKSKPENKQSNTGQDKAIIDVKGRVVNENNDPVEGVNVTVKGTNNVTSTNSNGEFILKGVDDNAILVFTSINMETFELNVKGKPFLGVALQTKITAMQEVVVNKGYYTEKKMLATGNVSSIKSKDIERQPVNNPLLSLVGRVPGLIVQQATGFSNSGVVVRIQGRNSLSSGLDPLYVIDGVPYNSQTLPTIQAATIVLGSSGSTPLPSGAGNPMSFINPNDIESIDVLKDADATAIYGSRGANGVILITTKKGKAGRTMVNVRMLNGWGKVSHKLDLLNTEQYLEMRREAKINDNAAVLSTDYDINGTWDENRYTDWQKVLMGGTSKYSDAQIGISGGTSNTQFLLNGGFHKETTVFPGDFSDRKGSIQFNVRHTNPNQKMEVQFSGTYMVDHNEIPVTDITQYAMTLAPNAPEIFSEDGSLNWAPVISGSSTVSTWTNPLSYLKNRYSNKVNNLISSALFSYRIMPNLVLKSTFGYTYMQSDEVSTSSLESIRPEQRATSSRGALYGNGSSNGWIIEPQATYQLVMRNTKIEALVGSSFQENKINRDQLAGSGHASDLLLKDIKAASSIIVQSNLLALYKYNALFGRLNYNFNDKFVINLTARRDGSSRFGSENLFQNFWGVAGAWVFSKGDLVSKNMSWLSYGKLRVSYGTSGNDQIGDYGFMNLYTPLSLGVSYQGIPSMTPNGHTNPYLQWEETKKLQFGLDIGLIDERILLNINYYRNRSSNLLTTQSLSITSGFTTVNQNFEGVVQNTGWEIALNTVNVKTKNFTWTTSINLTIPQQNGVLLKFPNFEKSTAANTYTIGRSLNDVKSYHFLGVNPATGLYMVADRFHNPTSSAVALEDRISYTNTSQKIFGGVQNSFSVKGFELDFLFQFVQRNGTPHLFSSRAGTFNGRNNTGNQPVWVLKRWQKAGDVTSVQRFTSASPADLVQAYSNAIFSDGFTIDASYFRLTNLSIFWQLPDNWRKAAHLQNGKIFLQGQNMFTVTNFIGTDPSLNVSTTMPPLRIITVGIQIGL